MVLRLRLADRLVAVDFCTATVFCASALAGVVVCEVSLSGAVSLSCTASASVISLFTTMASDGVASSNKGEFSSSPVEVEVSVSDNGCGLPDNPEAVFRPFTSTKLKGMGIGLPICRIIIEAHGGHLWAEPRIAGGAVFRFTLPIANQEAVHA